MFHQLFSKLISLIFVSFMVLISCREVEKSSFELINRTNKTISKIEVNVVGRVFVINNIQPNSRAIRYFSPSDSSYKIKIENNSNKVVEYGYITNGLVFHDKILIYQDKLQFQTCNSLPDNIDEPSCSDFSEIYFNNTLNP